MYRIRLWADFVIVILSLFCVVPLSFFFGGAGGNGGQYANVLQLMPFSYGLGIVITYHVTGLYRHNTKGKMLDKLLILFGINGLWMLFQFSMLHVLQLTDFYTRVMIRHYFLSSSLIAFKELCIKGVKAVLYQCGYLQKRYVIVGCGHLAQQYYSDILNNKTPEIVIVGYFGAPDRQGVGCWLGEYEQLSDALPGLDVDQVILAMESDEMPLMREVIACADKEGLRLSLIPFLNDFLPPHVTMDIVGKSKLIDMRATPLDNIVKKSTKRLVDLAGALLLVIVTGPLMLATAVGVKLSSPGPVFFKQDRVGKDQKPFRMLKFRSMRVNASQDTAWSTDSDPRKTRFGSIIRKLSIDELPQLFNVIKGDMSLVGPRPEIPHYVRRFKEDIPMYLIRQQVKPGMTGLAQVNGFRGDTSIEQRVKYDIWYIENWSLELDIKILLETVFRGKFVNNEELEPANKA